MRNKRDFKLLQRFPELQDIYKCIKHKCILDGELATIVDGIPVFSVVQRRSILNDPFKIELAAKKNPATYVAFDVIYFDGEVVTDKPLMERKKLLEKCFAEESSKIAYSRYIEGYGVKLFELAKQQHLEGIVAKKKDSLYWFDKETRDWVKIKVMADEDYVLCGYILKPNNMTSFVIGQYDGNELVYSGNEKAVWLAPELVCIVEYMTDESIERRQAVLKGIRDDKLPIECQVGE